MLKEFQDFPMKGNVLDMAIGIIIGAAFSKIVSSMISDMLMPPLGWLLGHVDFSSLFINRSGTPQPSLVAAKAAGAPTINYGVFLQTVFDFIIVAFAIFLVVKQVNRFKRPQVAASPTTKECPHCLSSIPIKAIKCAHCTSSLERGARGRSRVRSRSFWNQEGIPVNASVQSF